MRRRMGLRMEVLAAAGTGLSIVGGVLFFGRNMQSWHTAHGAMQLPPSQRQFPTPEGFTLTSDDAYRWARLRYLISLDLIS